MKPLLTALITFAMGNAVHTQAAGTMWNILTLNSVPRVIFVDDRFKAEGYDTQNAVHWPLSELNLQ